MAAPIKNPFGLLNWNKNKRAIKFEEKPILNHFIGYAVINPEIFKILSKKIINMGDGKGMVEAIKLLIQKKKSTFIHSMIYKLQSIPLRN